MIGADSTTWRAPVQGRRGYKHDWRCARIG